MHVDPPCPKHGSKHPTADVEATSGEWDGEHCQDCGRAYEYVWYAEDDLWKELVGGEGGLLCMDCFNKRAVAARLPTVWFAATRLHLQIDDETLRLDACHIEYLQQRLNALTDELATTRRELGEQADLAVYLSGCADYNSHVDLLERVEAAQLRWYQERAQLVQWRKDEAEAKEAVERELAEAQADCTRLLRVNEARGQRLTDAEARLATVTAERGQFLADCFLLVNYIAMGKNASDSMKDGLKEVRKRLKPYEARPFA